MRPREKENKAPANPQKDRGTIVLGIDPGSIFCGYGVVDKNGSECRYISSGRIAMTRSAPLHERLRELFEGLIEVIGEFSPQAGVVERIFFAKGLQAALSLGHARGVALLALANHGVPVFEYSALSVKKAVTGYGKAEKQQVQAMIKRLLSLSFPLSPDGADALALALCHIQSTPPADLPSKRRGGAPA